jgi:hypothetical protein
MTFIIANWKLVLIGLLVLALTGLFAVYSWQKSSLVASKATIKAQEIEIAGRDARIAAQQRNIEDIKKHGQRVQTITKSVQVIKEVIKEIPVASFSGDCMKSEEERNHEAENIKRISGGIVSYFNTGGVLPEGFNSRGGGEILPQTDKTGTDSPTESK